MIEEIAEKVREKLKAQHISPRVLLDRLRTMDDQSRRSGQYQDPNHLPFYYYLSKFMSPKDILNVGLDLALPVCCFLRGSESVSSLACMQRKTGNFYSPRLALSNIRDTKGRKFPVSFHHGSILDPEMQEMMSGGFDFVMITDRMESDGMGEILECCWKKLRLDGFMLVDRVDSEKDTGDLFRSFCKSSNRAHVVFSTRYGTGFVQK